jgi:hypothetical protein
MDNSASIIAQCPGESRLTQLGSDGEHVALLGLPGRFDLLRRKDDLLDEGVAAVFGLAGGEAALLGLCFHAEKFTPAEAATWLAGRGFVPLLLVPTSGGIGLVTSTLPRPLRLGGPSS